MNSRGCQPTESGSDNAPALTGPNLYAIPFRVRLFLPLPWVAPTAIHVESPPGTGQRRKLGGHTAPPHHSGNPQRQVRDPGQGHPQQPIRRGDPGMETLTFPALQMEARPRCRAALSGGGRAELPLRLIPNPWLVQTTATSPDPFLSMAPEPHPQSRTGRMDRFSTDFSRFSTERVKFGKER